jgi:hypothetical protein
VNVPCKCGGCASPNGGTTKLPPTISRLTGLRDAELRAAPRPELAIRRFLADGFDLGLCPDPGPIDPVEPLGGSVALTR